MDDSYLGLKLESKAEIKIKGSRFIGETFIVSDADAAIIRLGTVRRREFSASHHCYAYIVGYGKQSAFRYSDDGEPHGTAGKPIHDVLSGRSVTDLICVVTRYFGGTKLGTGGLVKAYSDCAREVMDSSGVVENFFMTSFEFRLGFPLYDHWQNRLKKLGGTVIESDFSELVTMRVAIRNSLADQLVSAFTELTGGKGQCEKLSSD